MNSDPSFSFFSASSASSSSAAAASHVMMKFYLCFQVTSRFPVWQHTEHLKQP